jgi:tetratricopeptide (TPR) repeat protein
MAYWGIAMSHWYPLWYPPGPDALKIGSDAVAKAEAAKPKTDRERGYIAAIAAFYRDYDKRDHAARAKAYEVAMEQLYLQYPDDREAAVFYALALNATASATDKTFASKKKAAEILNKVWVEEPNHPGVVHYLIHSDDTPQFAAAGLDAAICYSKIAPDVPHALHMPSHIFTRLGLWRQSIDSNRAAHDAASAYAHKSLGPNGFDGETVHTMDYLEYAYLQLGEDSAAKQVVDELASFRDGAPPNLPMAYAVAAIPVRYALERQDWRAAAALGSNPAPMPLDKFPWAVAMNAFGRAVGAAHTGDTAAAESEIANLQALENKLDTAKENYWANQVKVQLLDASAVLAEAKGDKDKALELARAAADLDATMDKHPATPSPVLPAREMLADLLLQNEDPKAALTEYDRSLHADPNRFRSLVGEARAARQSGDAATAKQAYQKLLTLAQADAAAARPELAEAKAFLAN